eukprot:TRINITY_DN60014_c0_g1_i1.p1 TRINITY_DN60014_c0_g1~~TRINITY_DN60014_c0_g1_i1.p1  ORF type:complete len:420 (-),score=40.78 TRINITY_DN60014_c0_g1_i1:59-1318(-)
MKHGSVYMGGMSRGDTPPRDIPTLGAAGGRPRVSEMTLKERFKPCPFARDEDARVLARHEGMYMDVIQKNDVPPGPILFPKDYDRMLMTHDLERAQPTLAHPISSAGAPIPWSLIQKPELAEVPYSRPKVHFPPLRRRPRDLSLKVDDIELAQAPALRQPRVRPDREPNAPTYMTMCYDAPPPPMWSPSGRHALDVSDIDGAQPAPALPVRNQYGNPMKCEDEFKSRRHRVAIAEAAASFEGTQVSEQSRGMASPRRAEATPRGDSSMVRPTTLREGHPLQPKYVVPVAEAGTTLHIRYGCERVHVGDDKPATVAEELGDIEGSRPKQVIRDNGEPQTSLCTSDIPGARPMRRAGVMPIHIYGPAGRRPPQSTNLDTGNIDGAQADTRNRGPGPKSARFHRGEGRAEDTRQFPQPLSAR